MAAPQDEFSDFVQKQQKDKSVATAIDWGNVRDEWLVRLDQLYEQVARDLDPYILGGTIRLAYSPIDLTEEHIGTYKARLLHIEIGKQIVTLKPIGTRLIGAKGRVDVLGSAGQSRFILADKGARSSRDLIQINIHIDGEPEKPPKTVQPSELVWKIASAPPAIQLTELNQDSLFQVLMEVSNG
ncbi:MULTISPECIES: hypothetical protein [unclassified Neorhizobium]|uniref:hypothetical protein n=1 Tax=unclassified Neorhizobium TaxID=2629175 RepID=UPI001FF6D89F|nr:MULTISPECIES: hypothetical protein [unclassified Neorhizobium]MCJ9674008.1 hypothetical protein [Neorhizobium sp. SHOUNA12B]MCJ9746010.1 hypothetical protein [Neorhizobium sp. SHOUNA12A]